MLSKCQEVFSTQTHVTNYVNDKCYCRTVDAKKIIFSESDESESDGGVDDEELLGDEAVHGTDVTEAVSF